MPEQQRLVANLLHLSVFIDTRPPRGPFKKRTLFLSSICLYRASYWFLRPIIIWTCGADSLVSGLRQVRADVTRGGGGAGVEVAIVLRDHVDVVKDEAIKACSRVGALTCWRLHVAGVHQHSLVEQLWGGLVIKHHFFNPLLYVLFLLNFKC